MRTVQPGPPRDSMDDLVRRRMDTLFGPEPPHPSPFPPAQPEHPSPPAYPEAAHAPVYLERAHPPGYPETAYAPPYPERPYGRDRADAFARPEPDTPVPALPRQVRVAPPAPPSPPRADPAPPDPVEPGPGALDRAHLHPRPRPHPRSRRSLVDRLRALLPLAVQERFDLDRRAVTGLSVLLVLALGYGVQHFWAGRPVPVAVPAAEAAGSIGTAGTAGMAVSSAVTAGPTVRAVGTAAAVGGTAGPTGPAVVVDVAGRVHAPGVRTLRPGSRVQDALRAAGGALKGTDLTGLNLARIVNDGEEIVVGAPAVAAVPGAAPGSSGGSAGGSPLSLNSATAEQLDALPGLGPVLVQRIIQYREQHGGFQSVDQLGQISGFGARRLKDLHPLLRP
ncbi:helix-hairpin-helix domain-containing protein [Streptacidiphilus cavernicola]|uniref:Helix-hairpin-helix domain-containing protein n=1 Tax=Streptacidiphilus cavernicola TaxID=3342716 RepID=A0ABV6VSA7_9ACTN